MSIRVQCGNNTQNMELNDTKDSYKLFHRCFRLNHHELMEQPLADHEVYMKIF